MLHHLSPPDPSANNNVTSIADMCIEASQRLYLMYYKENRMFRMVPEEVPSGDDGSSHGQAMPFLNVLVHEFCNCCIHAPYFSNWFIGRVVVAVYVVCEVWSSPLAMATFSMGKQGGGRVEVFALLTCHRHSTHPQAFILKE